MKYTYAYKTSDGVRHEAAMNAESREAVFESLRAKGIKAIKVIAADGSKANGEIRGIRKRVLAASVVGAALLAGTIVYLALRTPHPAPRTPTESPALVTLRTKTAAIAEKHKAEIVLADGDKAKIGVAVSATRAEAREVFKNILDELKEPAEQLEAKRLYGELMILADHDELGGK